MTGGCVVWITGLSGAGKTTVARLLVDRLVRAGRRPVLLDGDTMRAIVPVRHGYGRSDRLALALYYARLAHELSGQGHVVVCATISLFDEVHAWNRRHVATFLDVVLQVPDDELVRRRGARGPAPAGAVVGADIAPEFPAHPALVVANHGAVDADGTADRILTELVGPVLGITPADPGPPPLDHIDINRC